MSLLKHALVLVLGLLPAAGAVARDIPKPRLKPEKTVVETVPEAKSLAWPKNTGAWPRKTVEVERAKCATVLRGLALEYETMAPIGKPGGCGTPAPILIRAIRGTVIHPPAEASCVFAEQLHGWVTSSLQPSASSLLGRDLKQIDNASAYVCRRRNNSSSGKLSEHATANAFDIAQLRFAGDERTTVKGDWSSLAAQVGGSKKAKFLARIRRDACIRFTTVLGPGSDRNHGDHFHVDYARRKSGYRICK
jgi:hypothetical protein